MTITDKPIYEVQAKDHYGRWEVIRRYAYVEHAVGFAEVYEKEHGLLFGLDLCILRNDAGRYSPVIITKEAVPSSSSTSTDESFDALMTRWVVEKTKEKEGEKEESEKRTYYQFVLSALGDRLHTILTIHEARCAVCRAGLEDNITYKGKLYFCFYVGETSVRIFHLKENVSTPWLVWVRPNTSGENYDATAQFVHAELEGALYEALLHAKKITEERG